MQSAQEKLNVTGSPPASSERPSTPEVRSDTYTPRTVWQTPHGLPPNFNRYRSPRTAHVSKIVRRCLRLMCRLLTPIAPAAQS